MKNLLLLLMTAMFAVACGTKADKKKMPMDDMEMDMPMDDMKMLELVRTDALVILGTTGMTEAYAMEQGGTYKGKIGGAFVSTEAFKKALTMEEMDMNAGLGGFAPEVAVVDGFTFRMVAPAVVMDNFVVLCEDGTVYRFDLGVDEGTNELTLISTHK